MCVVCRSKSHIISFCFVSLLLCFRFCAWVCMWLCTCVWVVVIHMYIYTSQMDFTAFFHAIVSEKATKIDRVHTYRTNTHSYLKYTQKKIDAHSFIHSCNALCSHITHAKIRNFCVCVCMFMLYEYLWSSTDAGALHLNESFPLHTHWIRSKLWIAFANLYRLPKKTGRFSWFSWYLLAWVWKNYEEFVCHSWAVQSFIPIKQFQDRLYRHRQFRCYFPVSVFQMLDLIRMFMFLSEFVVKCTMVYLKSQPFVWTVRPEKIHIFES